MVRYAFTMIELIFALVIMGVVFITLPLILLNNSSNLEENLIQEAIFASSAKMGQILTFPWDANSPEPGLSLASTHVLGTSINGDSEFNRNTSDFRVGHFQQALHRRMTPSNAERNATAIGIGTGGIDAFDSATATSLINATSQEGYKKKYQVITEVRYTDDSTDYSQTTINFNFAVGTDTVVADSTNIKMVEITTERNATDGSGFEPILVLRTYSSNIGETDYYKRTY